MQKPRFPKAVEFLRNAMLGAEGCDLELAQELTKLVNELGMAEAKNEHLQAENEALGVALRMAQDIIEAQDELDSPYPVFPDDFYLYGEDAMSYQPTDEEIQEIVDDLYDVPLADGEFVEQTIGDTSVIKMRGNGVEQIIVAQGYASYIVPDEDDEDYEGCGDPDCECHI